MNILKAFLKVLIYCFIFVFSIVVFFCAYLLGSDIGNDHIYAQHNQEYIEICMKYGYTYRRCMGDLY